MLDRICFLISQVVLLLEKGVEVVFIVIKLLHLLHHLFQPLKDV